MRRRPRPILAALLALGIGGLVGFELSYGAADNQGSDAVFLTVIGSEDATIPSNLSRTRRGE